MFCLLWTLLPAAVYAMSSIFTKSVKLISFALLPCLFELDMLWTSHRLVFIFCQASWVNPCHVFVVMFECCSIFILMHLDGYLLLVADRCHICFACHFQTVHPISVIFILISTEIISPFQWHSWTPKLRPGSFIPLQIMHMHRIPHPAYHIVFMCWLFTMLCASFRCLLLRVGSDNVTFVRTRSSTSVCLLHGLVLLPCGILGKMIIPSKSLLSLLC